MSDIPCPKCGLGRPGYYEMHLDALVYNDYDGGNGGEGGDSEKKSDHKGDGGDIEKKSDHKGEGGDVEKKSDHKGDTQQST